MGNKATRQTSSKRALLASVLSLVLCAAMLVGTTFAWFTDSVTSGKNTIVAGNLDVELEYATADDTGALNGWRSVDGATDLFADGLWEPGYAQVVYLRVSNLGTLALKYQFSLNITSETPGTNVNGEQFLLSDYLQYGVVDEQDTAFATRAEAIAAVKNPVSLDTYTKAGNLAAGANPEYVALVVYMPETVGNEANYRGNAIPTIELGLNLAATQDAVESDSFDNTYDENADDALLFDGGTTTINQNVTVLNADGTAVTATGDGTVVNITGGRYDGGAGGNNACVWACPGATVNISDGTFTVGADASGAGNSVIYSSGGTVNISGGFFYTDYSWNNRYYVLNLQNGSGGTIRVTGGTFVNMDPSAGDDVDGGTFVADGYTVVSEVRPDGDIWYTVVKDVQNAADFAGLESLSGDSILSQDITLNLTGYSTSLEVEKTLNLDLNGKTVTLASTNNSNIFYALGVNGGHLTMNGKGTVDATAAEDLYCFHVYAPFYTRGTLTINDGSYYSQTTAVNVQRGVAIINGGFFDCDGSPYTINCIDSAYKNGTANIIVYGGTFVNFDPSNNTAEGAGTNYVAAGYTVVSEEQSNGDIWYTVVPQN